MLSGIFTQIFDLLVLLEPKTKRLYQQFKDRNKQALFEATSALEKSQKLAQHNEELIQRWEEDLKAFHLEKLELAAEIKDLERENKALLRRIVEHSKKKVKDTREAASVVRPSVPGKKPATPQRRPREARKTVKLTWLRETIAELFQAKQRQDRKVRENWARRLKNRAEGRESLKFETMEQFMYSHLKMRYGLKGLIIEQVEQIISGIKRYKDEHADVLLFGKILRNEVDEQYRLAQQNIRTSVRGSLTRVRARLPARQTRVQVRGAAQAAARAHRKNRGARARRVPPGAGHHPEPQPGRR